MNPIFESLLQFYGLDWLAFISGISGMMLITRKLRLGFALSTLSCLAGFATAALSGQFGFVVYNLLLATIMIKGYISWSKTTV